MPYLRHCRRISVISCRARLREMAKHRWSVTGLTRKSRASQLWCTTMLRPPAASSTPQLSCDWRLTFSASSALGLTVGES